MADARGKFDAGGIDAVVTGSGMAAINNALLAICQAGDEIVSGNSLFMSTFLLFNNVLKKLGITVKLVETADLSAGKGAVTARPTRLVGETVVEAGRCDWPEDKYPDFRLFKERKGKLAYIDKVWREIHINFGTTQSPFQSYLTLIGLDTLAVRMERHMSNAMALAQFLNGHAKVKWVNYPGLPSSPERAAATRQFGGKGYGALL